MSPTRKPSKSEEPDKTDYLAKRSRNNEAVRRSREKARMKAKDTHERVSQLKQENEMLEERIKLLTKELTFLKDIFLAHAGNYIMLATLAYIKGDLFLFPDSKHGITVDDMELRTLLQDDPFSSSDEVPR